MLSSARTLVREYTELVVFFFFLTTSLFLGDGKQPFVDVWWALGILTMYGVRYYQRGKLDLRALPHPVGFLWAVLVLYYIILTPFSDSVGYSITTTVRLVEGYLVYMMFVTVSSEKTTAIFIKGLLFVGVVAALASFVFLLVPSWTSFLPPMNLLYAAYGHNHLADLLLFVIPVAVGIAERKKNAATIGLLILLLVGMALTLARGAWIILIGYLLVVFLRKKDTRVKVIALVGAAVFVTALLLLSFVSTNKTVVGIFQKAPQATRLLQKVSFVDDGRWEYWRQAVEAIKERPFFGSGPGTFYLESKRLQARPNSYSWFAHSFPLETTVEVGAVGMILLSLVFIASLRRALMPPLFAPLLLTLLYSFFEFNLDYTAVWLLYWATLGLSLNNVRDNHQGSPELFKFVGSGLIVLSIFYATYISSIALDVVGRKKLAFYVAPYIVSTAKNHIEKADRDDQKLTPIEERIALMLYKKDSEVLIVLAKLNEEARNYEDALRLYEDAASVNSHNSEYRQKLFKFLLGQNRISELADTIKQTSYFVLPKSLYKQLDLIDFYSEKILNNLDEDIFQYKDDKNMSTLYYLLGMRLVKTDRDLAYKLLHLARDAYPELGHYHVELASIEQYEFENKHQVEMVLKECFGQPSAAQECRLYAKQGLPLLGEFESAIRN